MNFKNYDILLAKILNKFKTLDIKLCLFEDL